MIFEAFVFFFMGDFNKLPVKQFPQIQSDESKYWTNFHPQVITQELAHINHLNFQNKLLAVSSSTQVKLYQNNSLLKSISRFSDTVYCANIRADGNLLVAGDNSGTVQLFDLSSRAILRTMKHQGSVRVANFSPNKKHILSASDDQTVRLWDITTETPLNVFTHEDRVRSATMSDPNLILSGGYDHMLKIWDTRSNTCVLSMDHGSPIEKVIYLSGGGIVCSAGSNKIKMWDVKGAALIHSTSPHSKIITDMCLDATKSYLVSASIDRQVKVISLINYKVEKTIKYSAPILSLAISDDNSQIAVGMTTGQLSIRKRIVKKSIETASNDKKQIDGGSHAYFMRGVEAGKDSVNPFH